MTCCRYLQDNALTTFKGLPSKAPRLYTLNVSQNRLQSLEDLAGAEHLSSLYCANNQLDTADSISALKSCPNLQTVDLQGNELADFEGILEILSAMPNLHCLYLTGNPLVRATTNYRKRLINSLPNLLYLDDRAVSDKERQYAEAW